MKRNGRLEYASAGSASCVGASEVGFEWRRLRRTSQCCVLTTYDQGYCRAENGRKIEPDSRPQASLLFQQRSMAARIQPWHHPCYQPNCRVLQQNYCDGTSTTSDIDPLECKWMQLSPCKPHLSGDDSTWRRQTGSSTNISSMQPWRISPPQPNDMTSSWTPYEKSPEKTVIVGVEGTMTQTWHPSSSNWSKNIERNTKTIPSQIAPSHSGRNCMMSAISEERRKAWQTLIESTIHDPQQQEGVVHDTQALWRPVRAEAALQHHCEPSSTPTPT